MGRVKLDPTPTIYDDYLKCYLKLECHNPSGSHKDRETIYIINMFGWRKRYIVASSGNAGISLAYWMRDKATVVVPKITPKEKIEVIRRLGARVLIEGKYFYEAYMFCRKLAAEEELINISPGILERWRGDVKIGYEIKNLNADYIFIPSADLTLAYGIAYSFMEMKNKGIINKTPLIVACVLPNHPLLKICRDNDISEKYRRAFNSIYTFGDEGENIERRFADISFTKLETTMKLDAVLKLGEKYPKYDPAVLLAMYISTRYTGRKIVIVTGVKR
ncbi:MAG: PLP-dependent lyase/thiolase [Candidatus Verstraetearchaeota archaeon]|nr:PLP-dependent lyase/thiolase [Candidatus Verstraetearchaeota archaeon]